MDAAELLQAIEAFMGSHGKDERYKGALEALGGLVEALKPDQKTSPGRLAAKLAAGEESGEDAKEEAKETPRQEAAEESSEAQPKTFAEAKAAALEMAGR